MKKEWTEKHRREALRRTYEIAAEITVDGEDARAEYVAAHALGYSKSEPMWRDMLDRGARLDPARIDREVRRVRALAEGRLVREPEAWGVTAKNRSGRAYADLSAAALEVTRRPWTREDAQTVARKCGGRVYRHVRIRRAR